MPVFEDFYHVPNLNKISTNEFDLGSLLFKNGNFTKSLPYLKQAMSLFLEEENFHGYLMCYNMLLQIFTEFGDKQNLKELKQEVEDCSKYYNLSNHSRLLTCSAYYNIYIEKNMEQAKKDLDSARKIVFKVYEKIQDTKQEEKEKQLMKIITSIELISCLYFYSIYYYQNKDNEKALMEIKNVLILLEDLAKQKAEIETARSKTDNIQELKIHNNSLDFLKLSSNFIQGIKMAIKYLKANVELYSRNYEQSKKHLMDLLNDVNKTNYNLFTPYIYASMALNCIELKDKKEAKTYFDLAKKHISEDRKNLTPFLQQIEKKLKRDPTKNVQDYDLIFDLKEHTLVEKEKGCIELKNQFILMDLLKLFLKNPGRAYNKVDIFEKIWKQSYNPDIHDNKIYVTIKRLREIIERDSCRPKYICRNNLGYFFSKTAKVLIKTEED